MRVPVHLVRVLGYVIAATIVIAYYTEDLFEARAQSLFFLFIPIWSWCGWRMITYKEKVLPFSRAEKIFSNIFEVIFIAALVLRLVFVLLAK